MSAKFVMVSALLMTTAAFAQTGGAGSPGATAPGNPGVQGSPATPNTTGSGTTLPNTTVPNANINPGTGQKYDPSNLKHQQSQQSDHSKIAATPAPEL
jgi:hypothetical protein